jgi:predicted ATPase
MAARMTSSRLIGRVAELAELEAALRDAAGGQPSLAFVAGESGVGKSRMVAEFASRTQEAGARVEIGECVELGDEELPYAPIVSVLRSLAREGDSVLDELPPGTRAELATLLPELGAGTWPAGAEQLRANETTLGQPRLFEALLTLLEHLGREQPLVLVLEDIHWADRSTRGFLVFLGRSLWTERVLVVATYRSDELHRRHPLRPLLAELERDPRARRIELTRLTREELADLLADILGGPPDADLVERLYARSEGNPLFTEELLAAGLDGRGGLPTTLSDALMVRIERLSEPAQEVLRLLSAGQLLSHDVLAEASGLGGADLRAVVREAAESNVIVADARGRYRFRHALLREVVHDDLLPGEHAELHLALAKALEGQAAQTGEDAIITAGIAHHYLSAGCQREALVPRTPRSAFTPTARPGRCWSARSTCGRACPTPRRRPAATGSSWCGARARR